jgi:hypothetical protein
MISENYTVKGHVACLVLEVIGDYSYVEQLWESFQESIILHQNMLEPFTCFIHMEGLPTLLSTLHATLEVPKWTKLA